MTLAALATDYDGTLASEGRVGPRALSALERLKAAGKQRLLVTGRQLPQLRQVFERLDLFDAVVAENGAVLFFPPTGEERPLAAPPPEALIRRLRDQGVTPLSVGRTVVATVEPYEVVALETIRELGLDWEVIFNKGSAMCLPSGVNKASGLAAALPALGLTAAEVVAVGDAENDQDFLLVAGCAVAVANALPSLKELADFITEAPEGDGVAELVDRWLAAGDAFDPRGGT